MSSIIFQAADTRYITPNTYFMSHFGSTAAIGEYLSVQNLVKYEKQICDIMLSVYAKRCVEGNFFVEKYGKGASTKVKNYLSTKLKSGDWYITANEAVNYGFADKVVDSWQSLN
jgi:ATP-dependent protease ClpP protease subunit